jgi:hypothetical protein
LRVEFKQSDGEKNRNKFNSNRDYTNTSNFQHPIYIMKVEVNSAVEFVINILRVRQQTSSLNETQLHEFRGSLAIVLLEKYNNHWYENNPRKGE